MEQTRDDFSVKQVPLLMHAGHSSFAYRAEPVPG
jgi:hypothetical protein